jgi:hypothetical protein
MIHSASGSRLQYAVADPRSTSATRLKDQHEAFAGRAIAGLASYWCVQASACCRARLRAVAKAASRCDRISEMPNAVQFQRCRSQ